MSDAAMSQTGGAGLSQTMQSADGQSMLRQGADDTAAAAPVPGMAAMSTQPIRLSVVHETEYQYESMISVSRQLLHLAPRALASQSVLSHRLCVTPAPAEVGEGVDYFGNRFAHALITAPHRTLTIVAESHVTLGVRMVSPAAGLPAPWEAVRDLLVAAEAAPARNATHYLFESPHVAPGPQLLDYASASFAAGRPLFEAALDLNGRIHRDFEFDPTATTVSTPLQEVLAQRRGVCQDFAHLMIGCLRSVGLAARYVSGYLLTQPPPGMPRLVGSDASHAWVAVYCPGCAPASDDWIDFDPTNDCLIDREHVTLAWGRDFSDVTPARGVILGGGEHELSVRVTVTPEDPPPA
jgi:transglutaminase-like putative cysteine protease